MSLKRRQTLVILYSPIVSDIQRVREASFLECTLERLEIEVIQILPVSLFRFCLHSPDSYKILISDITNQSVRVSCY